LYVIITLLITLPLFLLEVFTVSTPSLPTQVEIIGGFAPRTRSTIGQTQPGRNWYRDKSIPRWSVPC